MSMFAGRKTRLPDPDEVLPGRDRPVAGTGAHVVLGTPTGPPFPDHTESLMVAMGCFWGAERLFWQTEGVYTTAVGYAGGGTPNPTYEEVCSGRTGHTEVVLVVFDPAVGLDAMLRVFWENHDPTQGMRQGNDVGTQYRSAVYLEGEDRLAVAQRSRDAYQQVLSAAGYGPITTEIASGATFYCAEDYHQQYLAKNPWGYCGMGGTGQRMPDATDADSRPAPAPVAR